MTQSPLLTFAGAYRDPIVAGFLLGNGYRCFLPGLMRFNAPDSFSPFGRGHINPYVYCSDDPINRIDPSGHSDESVVADLVNDLLTRIVKEESDRPIATTQAEANAAASEAGTSSGQPPSRNRGNAEQAPTTASSAHSHEARAPLQNGRRFGRTLRAAKRPTESVQVRFAEAGEKVDSWEGNTHPQPGDAVLTGGGGDTWHVPLADFNRRYNHEPGSNIAYPRAIPVTAVEMPEAFTAQPPWSPNSLVGKPGDFLVIAEPGNAWPVDRARFYATYDVLDD